MQIATVERNVRSSGMGEATQFSIDEQEFGFIAGILSDKLYSDKIGACVREYCCNATDANIESGATRNALISPPTRFDPVFKIRDFGLGLSRYDIENVYVKFGKSTKRNSNSVVGAFGLGSKSGFSYADSFNVISWHNGICSSYTAQKMPDGKLTLIHISDVKSDEPSGIEVSLAVEERDVNSFCEKIKDFCKYNGNKFDFASAFDVPQINYRANFDKFFIEENPRWGYNPCKVVMGGVVYSLDLNMLGKDFRDLRGLVLRAEIGDVDVSPTRETLEYSDKTVLFLNNLFTEIIDTVKADTQKKIDEQTDVSKIYPLITAMNNSFGGNIEIKTSLFTYKGRKICNTKENVKYYLRDGSKYYAEEHQIGLSNIQENAVLVKVSPDSRIIPSRLAKGYFEKYGVNPSKIIVSDDKEVFETLFCDFWKPESIIVDYKSMWAKIAKRNGVSVYDPNTYVYENKRKYRRVLLGDVKDNKNFLIVEGRGLNASAEDYDLVNAASQLGITFYAVKKGKKKTLDNTWSHLSVAVVKEIEAKIANMGNLHLYDAIARIDKIDDVMTLAEENKDALLAAGEKAAVDLIEDYVANKDKGGINPFLLSVYEKHGGKKVTVADAAAIDAKAKIIKDFRTKYDLAVRVYDSCGWRVEEFKKPLDNYIKMLDKTSRL